ncbi:S66 peptidase family protein [Aquabacterium sp.]|uniref:S66 peptidase family protein n=1 Tax=Aquabacterium sp. TaxID=1872578 RepID=UPI002CA94A2A|nr:LD-carboxypeptidase [Aquabacterium sp.]HSW03834.1 LD-carboxypeptidase [Aquabacterium sp.]
MSSSARRHFITHSASLAAACVVGTPAFAQSRVERLPLTKAPRLKPGDTIGLANPSSAIYERQPYELATETLTALGFKVREGANLRARHGHFAGTDAQRAADLNAMFADPTIHGILALTGGSGANRILPLLDYAALRRTPKVLAGFSDITALINAVHARTGLVTFHAPVGASEWNEFSVRHFRGVLMEAQAMTLRNPRDLGDLPAPKEDRITTLRPGIARGPLVGGNLAVLSSLAGSAYLPSFDGAILFFEEVNEFIYRVDRMLSTLKLSGALDRLAGVVLGAFTNCNPGESFGSLTLDEVFDDYFRPLNVPVYRGAMIGHIRRKFTVPVGLEAEIDAGAGTIRLLSPAVA